MTAPPVVHSVSEERDWYIVGRRREFEGEGRANLLDVAGVTRARGSSVRVDP